MKNPVSFKVKSTGSVLVLKHLNVFRIFCAPLAYLYIKELGFIFFPYHLKLPITEHLLGILPRKEDRA